MKVVNELHLTQDEYESILSFYDFVLDGIKAANRVDSIDDNFYTAWYQLKADIEYFIEFYSNRYPNWIDK